MPYVTSFEQSGIEKARAEGWAQGWAEGWVEGQREVLLEILTSILEARFGDTALAVYPQLSDLDLQDLKALPVMAVTDDSLEQFRARLQGPAS